MKKEKVLNYVIDFGNGLGKLISIHDGKKEEVIIDYLESSEVDTPEPQWPWVPRKDEEEYRLFTPLDDHTNELIKNMSLIYSKKWNLSFRDSYKLMNLAYCQKWRLKDIIEVAPIILEKILTQVLKFDFEVIIQEMVENEELTPEEGQDFLENLDFIPEELVNDYIIYEKYRNFTGEVRLVNEDNFEDDFEDNSSREEEWKLLLNIVTVKDGKKAYNYSQQIKACGNNRIIRYLPLAWELRRKLMPFTPEERIKKLRELGIYW